MASATAIVPLLTDPDETVRSAAVDFLGGEKEQREKVRASVTILLGASEGPTRLAAARVLAAWGDLTGFIRLLRRPGPKAGAEPAPGTTGTLRPMDPERVEVVNALAGLGTKAAPAVGALMELEVAHPAVLGALAEIGELDSRGDAGLLAAVPTARLRSEASVALGRIVRANPRLLEVLRPQAARFARLPDPALCVLVEAEALTPEIVERVADRLTQPEAATRREALDLLAAAGRAAQAQAPAVRRLLRDPDPEMRRRAVETFGRLGAAAPEAVAELRAWLLDSDDEALRRAAAEALGRLGQLGEVLLPLLEHAEVRVRAHAFAGFVAAGPVASVRFAPQLAARAVEPDPQLVLTVLRYLREFGRTTLLPIMPSTVDALRARLTDPNPRLRVAAAQALRQIVPDAPRDLSGLVALTADPDLEIARLALAALGGGGEALQPWVEPLTDLLTGRAELRGDALAALRSAGLLAEGSLCSQLPRVAERGVISAELLQALDEASLTCPQWRRTVEGRAQFRRWLERVPPADRPILQAHIWAWAGRWEESQVDER